MLSVLYLVHDLTDAAVSRRAAMLEAGGATVTVAGFRRDGRAARARLGTGAPIDLGETRDGKFAQRILAVAGAAMALRTRLGAIAPPDVVIARNLEMLALADRAAGLFSTRPAIVYESLDIHRLLLGDSAIARTMRAAERRFGRDVRLLLTSSPAFLREYFEPYGQIDAPTLLLENKVFDLDGAPPAHPPIHVDGEPCKIGWFGALRCSLSLDMLIEAARRLNGRIELVLRGRPAYDAIPDFDARVAAAPHITFHGAYHNPDDLAAIYGEVHFNWAIDFFQEGMNSEWLLPNRLYEGGKYGAVPIVRAGTETARFVADRGIGFVLEDCSADGLVRLFAERIDEIYVEHRARSVAIDTSVWTANHDECRNLVTRLAAISLPATGSKVAA